MGKSRRKTSTRRRHDIQEDVSSDAFQAQASTRMSQPVTLPIELISMIIDEYALQPGDFVHKEGGLARFARCSRAFQEPAERRLYRNVEYSIGTLVAQKIAAVLRSRAAPYVRNLFIYGYGPAVRRGRSSSRHGVSALPFKSMVGLRRLQLSCAASDENDIGTLINPELFHLLETALPENTLLKFVCRRHLLPSNLKFLNRQSTIESLVFRFLPLTGYVEPRNHRPPFTKLIELNTAKMNDAVMSLMEGTNIRSFGAESFFIHPNWSAASRSLCVLDLAFCHIGPSVLPELIACSPGLRLLFFALGDQWLVDQANVF
ncbi:hypothetical protein SISSUDRAFT_1053595 [Sistotremastrum suecicum HHB10207 ss-3]|uniref:F-box domain-containing protein n=1 Tax=Sistotremastrum suecicum HHB10207 ss-3 TaxID=1314776 RepID=A0A165Z4C3_9AGAM|nr:hypothetical protein SISSUDRAFT_1053595 [Sistotremastrum suecicum HHB10207 ss-3]